MRFLECDSNYELNFKTVKVVKGLIGENVQQSDFKQFNMLFYYRKSENKRLCRRVSLE